MDEYIESYLESRSEKSSGNTIAAYRRDLTAFRDFFARRGKNHPCEISISDANYYVKDMKEDLTCATIKRRMSVLRTFYAFLVDGGICESNPFAKVKSETYDTHEIAILTKREVEELLSQPSVFDFKGIRDKAMLEMLYATGMRVSELLALDLGDVNTKTGIVVCRSAKRERTIALYPIASRSLKNYIETARYLLNGSDTQTALFLNVDGGRMTRQGFWKILKNYAESAGITRNISPHTLRHSFAAHLLENGADAKDVQEIMGNLGSATIKEYIKYLKVKSKDELIKHHPRAKSF